MTPSQTILVRNRWNGDCYRITILDEFHEAIDNRDTIQNYLTKYLHFSRIGFVSSEGFYGKLAEIRS